MFLLLIYRGKRGKLCQKLVQSTAQFRHTCHLKFNLVAEVLTICAGCLLVVPSMNQQRDEKPIPVQDHAERICSQRRG